MNRALSKHLNQNVPLRCTFLRGGGELLNASCVNATPFAPNTGALVGLHDAVALGLDGS